jgi:hypothetical protein
MKKTFFVAAIAAAAMFASCSKEENNNSVNGEAESAKITIALNEVQSRAFAIDPDEEDIDNTINDLIVFVTRTDGVSFDVAPIFVDGDDMDNNEFTVMATTKADKVFIVTNTGAIANGPFSAVTNMDDVRAAAAKADGSAGNGNAIVSGNVWMSGESTALTAGTADAGPDTIPGTEDDIPVKEASIQLWYIPAKVYVAVTNSMTNYIGGNTVIEGVTITNAGAWTGFINSNTNTAFSATNRPDYRVARTTDYPQFPFYVNGLAIENTLISESYSDVPAKVNGANDFVVDADFTNTTGIAAIQTAEGASTDSALTVADAFYIFPAQFAAVTTDPSPEKVWADVYGTFDADGTGTVETAEQRFWPMAFGGEDKIASELKSGNKYLVTLELAGDGKIDTGTEDPTEPVNPQILKITVIPAEWNVSNPHKIFN